MKAITCLITAVILVTIIATAPSTVKAASLSDMPASDNQPIASGSNSNSNSNSTVTPQTGEKIILTAVVSKPIIKPGSDAGVSILAHSEKNDTAIPGVDIKAQYVNYFNTTDKVNLRGVTDKTGDFETSTQIPDSTKNSQWVILIAGDKPGFKHTEVSTGFAVSTHGSSKDFGGSSSSSSSSSSSGSSSSNGNGKCSGSSCK